MGDPIEVSGGHFVAPARWLEALQQMGCRAEFQPGDPAPILGGEFWLRFGHPAVAGGEDVLVKLSAEYHWPAVDVPAEVTEHRRARLRRLRELNAFWTLVDHEAMVIGWITRGREGVAEALTELIEERRRGGASDDDLAQELQWLHYWREPDAALPQCALFDCVTSTLASLVAAWILAVGYAAAAGGEVIASQTAPTRCEPQVVERYLAHIEEWLEPLFGGQPPPELSFEGWDRVPADDEDEEDNEPAP